ncbi:MAG: DNA alkylation repair protein [Verrucomicrobia subdivision 3 bacterium]|nr:DNA alkylation repair protein [Limisphaerales bacterium]
MSAHATNVLAELHRLANPTNVAGMARFGIVGKKLLGISVVQLRAIAKRIGRDHELAEALWASGIFEARILAAFIADPKCLTRRQAKAWAKDFECWADCDGLCLHLFRKTPFAHELAVAWSHRREELVKRAGFTRMATLAVHDKAASNEVFRNYLGRVQAEATDERHNVKKGANWALRQIGKRNQILNREAVRIAKHIQKKDSKAARWIAADALRELERWKPR